MESSRGPGSGYWREQLTNIGACPPKNPKITASDLHLLRGPRVSAHPAGLWRSQTLSPHPWVSGCNHSRPLFCPQHTSTLGSVFGDAFYEQQMTARQANALSRQVSGCPGLWAAHNRTRPHGSLCGVLGFTTGLLSGCGSKDPGKGDDHTLLAPCAACRVDFEGTGEEGGLPAPCRGTVGSAGGRSLGAFGGSLESHLPTCHPPVTSPAGPWAGGTVPVPRPHGLSWSLHSWSSST